MDMAKSWSRIRVSKSIGQPRHSCKQEYCTSTNNTYYKFSTLDNAFRVLWLVIISYTLVWPYMVNDFSLNKAKKEKKNCGKFGSMPTFRSTPKGKKCFLWWDYVCLIRRCYEHGTFIKFFFRFALVGYETGYSQLGATRLVGYLPSHIQRVLME